MNGQYNQTAPPPTPPGQMPGYRTIPAAPLPRPAPPRRRYTPPPKAWVVHYVRDGYSVHSIGPFVTRRSAEDQMKTLELRGEVPAGVELMVRYGTVPWAWAGGSDLSGYGASGDFARFGRFGAIDGGLTVLAALFGFSLDNVIAKRIGVKGYGPIMGAAAGNAIADGIAALPEGRNAALGVVAGAMIPVIPLGLAMYKGRALDRNTRYAMGALSAGLVVLAFLKKGGFGRG